MVRRHAELLAGLSDERGGLTELRKHMAWYFKGFPVGGELRRALAQVSSFAELDASPGPAARGRRLSAEPNSGCRAAGRARRGTGWPCPTAGSPTPPELILISRRRSSASPVVDQASPRARQWAETMAGHPHQGLVRAHADSLIDGRTGTGDRP